MTPEGERLENLIRADHDDYDDWDAFSQISALTYRWLKERGELPERIPGTFFHELPTQKQMMECAFDLMGDGFPVAGHA